MSEKNVVLNPRTVLLDALLVLSVSKGGGGVASAICQAMASQPQYIESTVVRSC